MTGTALRLWAAAFLCALPLGFDWSGRLVSQAPVRVFLVAAAAAFLICGARARTAATLRLARAGCLSLAVAAALAAGHGAVRVLICVVAALALVGPRVLAKRRVPG